ncbi:hypothetical protein [Kurthia gibsonii]|uniref:hypothetical protein n=1 Tax=Kurthia gibsonii TaxID=33946 RepID=UPI003015BF15
MTKKFILKSIIFSIFLTSVFFNIDSTADARRVPHVEIWKIESISKEYYTSEYGSWRLIYKGQPAKRKGEYDTISASEGGSVSITGDIAVSKGAIASSLGYALEKNYSFSGSKNSAALKKGEYTKGYVKRVAVYSKVTQRKYVNFHGTKPTNEYKTAYVRKPSAITLRIDYYNKNKKKKKSLIFVKGNGSKKWIQQGKPKYYV